MSGPGPERCLSVSLTGCVAVSSTFGARWHREPRRSPGVPDGELPLPHDVALVDRGRVVRERGEDRLVVEPFLDADAHEVVDPVAALADDGILVEQRGELRRHRAELDLGRRFGVARAGVGSRVRASVVGDPLRRLLDGGAVKERRPVELPVAPRALVPGATM